MRERSWIVGSLPECDLRVESPTVSGKHCRLTQRGNEFLLEDLQSTNGTFVRDERLAGPRIVRRGDAVTLGHETPLPWSSLTTSIRVGRLPDNDVVIPFDAVSGRHARLERAGPQCFLIDLGSTNGTAINDLDNRISRAPLLPTDFVFFGTHRVAAADLLAALPADPEPAGTMLERSRPAELSQAAAVRASSKHSPTERHTWATWLAGAALSVVCLVVILGGRALLRSWQAATVAATDSAFDARAESRQSSPAVAPATVQRVDADPRLARPAEQVLRQAEAGVALVGLRVGGELLLSSVKTTCWACGSNTVICPTAILERLEDLRKQGEGRDISLVVCTPEKTLAILSHKKGADGFSVATLESSLEIVCPVGAVQAALALAPGQGLAVLSASTLDDEPSAIQRNVCYLTIDRIERADDASPKILHCASESAPLGALSGSPVFDASGHVVGCVESSVDRVMRVVAIERLAALLPAVK